MRRPQLNVKSAEAWRGAGEAIKYTLASSFPVTVVLRSCLFMWPTSSFACCGGEGIRASRSRLIQLRKYVAHYGQ